MFAARLGGVLNKDLWCNDGFSQSATVDGHYAYHRLNSEDSALTFVRVGTCPIERHYGGDSIKFRPRQ